jgi:hypothetical protein
MARGEPRSIGGVLDDGLRLWRMSIAQTWLLAAVSQLLLALPTIPFMPISNGAAAAAPADLAQAVSTIKSPLFWVCLLLSILMNIGVYNSLTLRVVAVANEAALTLRDSMRKGFALLPRALWLFVMLAMGASAVAFPIVLLGFGLGGGAAAMTAQPWLKPATISVLLGIPLVFLIGRLFLAPVILVADDEPPFAAAKLSWSLTGGHWWRCTTILTVATIIFLALGLVEDLLSSFVDFGLGTARIAATVVDEIIGVVLNSVLGSLLCAVMLTILHDLRLRKEGADLAARVSALEPV